MKIENARISELKPKDVIDLHGLIFDFISSDGYFRFKYLNDDCLHEINESMVKSITIHRESPIEKLDREIAELQAKRAALVGKLKPINGFHQNKKALAIGLSSMAMNVQLMGIRRLWLYLVMKEKLETCLSTQNHTKQIS